MGTRLLTCTCNATVDIAAARLDQPLAGTSIDPPTGANELCRREIGRFVDALAGTDELTVTCTQESALFLEVARSKATVAPIRFVNLRETGGWGKDARKAGPKLAALVAMAATARQEPVPAVNYQSRGRLLVIGDAATALRWAQRLAPVLSVTVLMTSSRGAALPAQRSYPVLSGRLVQLSGHLGEFAARWELDNPIDLDACVRCGACVTACPEQAIGADFQVDLNACRAHRSCVAACGAIGAIDFARADPARSEVFDLVLDLRAETAFAQHQPPQGYFHPGADADRQTDAALALAQMIGEFEKPKFFRYRQNICAHGRNEIKGCTRCIDVCSTRAISSAGDAVVVDPHLCMGCGACATVCPSGALGFSYPAPSELGRRMRHGLQAYRDRQGRDPVLLFHDEAAGARLIEAAFRPQHGLDGAARHGPVTAEPRGDGLPANVIPVAVHDVASIGIDVALAAIAYGASAVAVLYTTGCAPQYLAASRREFELAETLVSAIGLGSGRFQVLQADHAAGLSGVLFALRPAPAIEPAASFALPDEKRRAVEFSLDHLVAQAARRGATVPRAVPLAAGAPFGSLNVDQDLCTLCLACVGACPESALLDSQEKPQLRFLERNCVQCGLCASTCPEKAIALEPRYLFAQETGSARIVNEAQPYLCVSCGKPFGTRQMIETMLSRLSGHSMFGGEAVKRLKMCADCRVVDMFSNPNEMSIHDIPKKR